MNGWFLTADGRRQMEDERGETSNVKRKKEEALVLSIQARLTFTLSPLARTGLPSAVCRLTFWLVTSACLLTLHG